MNNQTVNVTAKSLDLALVKAAGMLGIPQGDIQYEVTKENNGGGIFGFFKSPQIEIKAWAKTQKSRSSNRASYQSQERQEKRTPSAPAKPLSNNETTELIEELRLYCQGICEKILQDSLEVEANQEDDRLVLNIKSKEFITLFQKNAKLAEALEHLLRKKPRHLKQELPFRIFVDVDGTRKDREEELIQMAADLSNKVHEKKRPIVLNYRSAYDRKIIHMALDQDKRVYTKSIGSGPNRKLMILPFKENGQSHQENVN